MLNTSKVESYLAEVRAFADKVGKREQLEAKLKYLDEYANGASPADNPKTECVLMKDFAPYSFYFVMQLRERDHVVHKYECDKCGYTLESEGQYHGEECFECKGTVEKGKLHVVGVEHKNQKESFWFNGGLTFHGKHDNGGDGGAPTFSVNLSPSDGWEIHT